jgi:hypothetical protein
MGSKATNDARDARDALMMVVAPRWLRAQGLRGGWGDRAAHEVPDRHLRTHPDIPKIESLREKFSAARAAIRSNEAIAGSPRKRDASCATDARVKEHCDE